MFWILSVYAAQCKNLWAPGLAPGDGFADASLAQNGRVPSAMGIVHSHAVGVMCGVLGT